jgi:hypothetical protein
VFHRSYHDADLRPGYVQNERPYGCKD